MRPKYLIILSLTIAGLLIGQSMLQGQEQLGLRSKADKLFYQFEYYSASRIYEKLVDVKKPKSADMERLAMCYLQINEYSLARNWYSRVVDTGQVTAESLINYADVLKKLGYYTEAKKQYAAYAQRSKTPEAVALALQGCDSALLWMANPTHHKLKNEDGVNTRLSDFGTFSTGDNVLYVGESATGVATAGLTGRSYLRVFSSNVGADGMTLQSPYMVTENFNEAAYHVGPIVSSKDGNTLYVTRTYPGKDTEKHRSGPYRFKKHNLEIKIYQKDNTGWKDVDFPYNDIKKYSVGHAALSENGQILYFASDMPGGLGGVDIWYCEMQANGNWGVPVNAGDVINSVGDEMFPSVFGDVLYYSSNGFAGMGGLDIFSAKGSKSNFSNRTNLRFPINSASDDFGFIEIGDDEKGKHGYLSSNRMGGLGLDDIYSYTFVKPKITILLEGLTRNRSTQEILSDVQVTLFDSSGKIVSNKLTATDGQFAFELEPKMAYRLMGEKVKFHGDSINISALNPSKDTVIRVELALQPIFETGTVFVLENIYYDLDKYNIRPDAQPILNQLVNTMRDNPTLKIELSSHTDSRATAKYNLKLSQNRAQSAVDYIVSRGIARDRIVAKGYGESKLVNRCADNVKCSEAEHQANRRTEVKVLVY
ncbi:OmpA family protein [Sphingobacterium sp. SYP-B4668]|uniref:OmpA family protein n=1 Tax=Sphingobacterium sp. SYP-B4668 TaxID=2996035 RepID=UPI0022DDD825|nr:OmpA family protein [Sphingobacterium sp. SYP-B4668]